MSIERTRSALALSSLTAVFLFSTASFGTELVAATANPMSEDRCAAETWPNISADCAGAKAPRKVRVISLDKEAPASVPLPDAVRAAYASKQADAKAAVNLDVNAVDGRREIAPMAKLSGEGAEIATDDATETVETASGAPRKAVSTHRERAKKVAKRRVRERYDDQYGETMPSYRSRYGYERAAPPVWRSTRNETPFGWSGNY